MKAHNLFIFYFETLSLFQWDYCSFLKVRIGLTKDRERSETVAQIHFTINDKIKPSVQFWLENYPANTRLETNQP